MCCGGSVYRTYFAFFAFSIGLSTFGRCSTDECPISDVSWLKRCATPTSTEKTKRSASAPVMIFLCIKPPIWKMTCGISSRPFAFHRRSSDALLERHGYNYYLSPGPPTHKTRCVCWCFPRFLVSPTPEHRPASVL